jgi:hypothetical protein
MFLALTIFHKTVAILESLDRLEQKLDRAILPFLVMPDERHHHRHDAGFGDSLPAGGLSILLLRKRHID